MIFYQHPVPVTSPEISNFDWITLGIAIAGFVMSLLSWVYTALTHRKQISLVIDKTLFSISTNELVLYVQFLNRSRLAIAISDVQVVLDGDLISCDKDIKIYHTSVHKFAGSQAMKDFYTQPFPLQLQGLGGSNAVLLFALPPNSGINLSKSVTIKVLSNRGALPEKRYDIRPEYRR